MTVAQPDKRGQAEETLWWPPQLPDRGKPKLYVVWTSPAPTQETFRNALIDLIHRMEALFDHVGVAWRREAVTWATQWRKVRAAKWTPLQEEKLLTRFNDEAVQSARVGWVFPDRQKDSTDPPNAEVSEALNVIQQEDVPEDASMVAVGFRTNLLTDGEVDQVAEALLAWMGPLAQQLDATHAYVTRDHFYTPSQAPYEVAHALQTSRPKLRAREHPRGYYWANLLNPVHLETLGGGDVVTEQAKAAGLTAEPIFRAEGESSSMLLRIPSPITRVTRQQIRAVRDLLAPALLPPVRPYQAVTGVTGVLDD